MCKQICNCGIEPEHYACAIEILDTQTGEIAAFEEHGSIGPDEGDPSGVSDFMWKDGNWSCDCNRHLFWLRAQDLEKSKDHVPCGYSRFLARATRLDTGGVVFDEIRRHQSSYCSDFGR